MIKQGLGFWSRRGIEITLLMALVLGVFGVMVYIFVGQGTRQSLTSQILQRKVVLARSGAKSILSFFDLTGHAILSLSKSAPLNNFDEASRTSMEAFIDIWKGTPFVGLALIDENGIVRYFANRQDNESGVGTDFSDRDYFIRAKESNTSEVIYSAPMLSRGGVSQGQYIIVVAAPLYTAKGQFHGVLAGSVLLSRISTQYIDPLKTTSETVAHLVKADDAVVVYSDNKEMVGKSIFDSISKNDFLGKDYLLDFSKKMLVKNEEGSLVTLLPSDKGLTPYLLAWSPVRLGGYLYQLAIVTPEQTDLALIAPFM